MGELYTLGSGVDFYELLRLYGFLSSPLRFVADSSVSCAAPPAADAVEETLDLLLDTRQREAECGRFVARSALLVGSALFALLELLAAFEPLLLVLDHRDPPVRAVVPIIPVSAFVWTNRS
jgi:hypothetical protein